LGKKTIKKNRFNIVTGLDTYKSEFLKNANLTLYKNIFDKNNLHFNNISNISICDILNDNKQTNNSNKNVFLSSSLINYPNNDKVLKNYLKLITATEQSFTNQTSFC